MGLVMGQAPAPLKMMSIAADSVKKIHCMIKYPLGFCRIESQ